MSKISGITRHFTITDARETTSNGVGTEHQVVLDCEYETDDSNGNYQGVRQFNLPIPYRHSFDCEAVIGGRLTITVLPQT